MRIVRVERGWHTHTHFSLSLSQMCDKEDLVGSSLSFPFFFFFLRFRYPFRGMFERWMCVDDTMTDRPSDSLQYGHEHTQTPTQTHTHNTHTHTLKTLPKETGMELTFALSLSSNASPFIAPMDTPYPPPRDISSRHPSCHPMLCYKYP